MVRTQIQLTETQAQGLKELATSRGTSMADLIREAVDHLLARSGPSSDELRARARAAAGRFHSGLPGLAKDHDRFLTETVLAEEPS